MLKNALKILFPAFALTLGINLPGLNSADARVAAQDHQEPSATNARMVDRSRSIEQPSRLYAATTTVSRTGDSRSGQSTAPPVLQDQWELGDWRYGLCRPTSVAVAPSGEVFVVTEDASIWKYDTEGEATKWGGGGQGSADGQFKHPRGIAVDASGNVFVVDTGNERIQKFDNGGRFLLKWGTHAVGNTQTGYKNGFFMPSSIAVDGAGHVYVADEQLDSVQIFDNNGGLLSKFGGYKMGRHQLNLPDGVAIDAAGSVYVVDRGNNQIQKFDSNGRFLTKWGKKGHQIGEFIAPRGIAVDSANNVYVADGGNSRIQEFDSNGKFLATWGTRDGFADRAAITAKCRQGESSACEKMVKSPPVFTVSGLAIDRNDTLYVIDNSGCLVYKFHT